MIYEPRPVAFEHCPWPFSCVANKLPEEPLLVCKSLPFVTKPAMYSYLEIHQENKVAL